MLRTAGCDAFTIVELLIVVIVIGVLAAAGLARYQNFAETSRRKACPTHPNTIESGLGTWETTHVALAENAKTVFRAAPGSHNER